MNRNYVKIEKPNNLKTKRYIIDNVLPEMVFDSISSFVMGSDLFWNLIVGTVNEGESDDWRFTNAVYHSKSGFTSNKFSQFSPIFDFLHIQNLITVKLNCDIYTRIPEQREFHTDNVLYSDFAFTSILYFNDCNGKTIFEDGTEIESRRNRMIIFNSHQKHAGISQTDVPRRYLMNINFQSTEIPIGKEF